MSETDTDRFLKNADECFQQAEKAHSPLDQEMWLRLAEEWKRLAQAAKGARR
jgi:hypothetical protein